MQVSNASASGASNAPPPTTAPPGEHQPPLTTDIVFHRRPPAPSTLPRLGVNNDPSSGWQSAGLPSIRRNVSLLLRGADDDAQRTRIMLRVANDTSTQAAARRLQALAAFRTSPAQLLRDALASGNEALACAAIRLDPRAVRTAMLPELRRMPEATRLCFNLNPRALTRSSDEQFRAIMLRPMLPAGQSTFTPPDAERDARVLDVMAHFPDRVAGMALMLAGNARLVRAAFALSPDPVPHVLWAAAVATGKPLVLELIRQHPESVTPALLRELVQNGMPYELYHACGANTEAALSVAQGQPLGIPARFGSWVPLGCAAAFTGHGLTPPRFYVSDQP